MDIAFRDSVSEEKVIIADPSCAACGATEKLCLDHDRWYPVGKKGYRRRVLCRKCNHRKGGRQWVSYPDRTCWVPGMPTGMRIPNPFLRPPRRPYGRF